MCVDQVSKVQAVRLAIWSLENIRRYGGRARRWSEPWSRWPGSRLIGPVVYAGLVAWTWYFMPSVFLFVLIVVVVPALLWPAGPTGEFSELNSRL